MKKLSLLLALLPILAWAQLDKQLANTTWEIAWHQGNADTYAFTKIPANAKELPYKYLAFRPGNQYRFYYHFNENCETDVRGKYSVEKSHIDFTTESTTNGKNCEGEPFELGRQSVVFRGETLYMTPYNAYYDEAPKKSGDTLLIPQEMVGRMRGEGNNFYTLTDASYIPLADGLYKTTAANGTTMAFGIKDGLPEGRMRINMPEGRREMLFRKGRNFQEKVWRDGQLALIKTNTAKAEKQGVAYAITLIKATHNFYRSTSDSLITVYRDQKPAKITSYKDGALVSEKDYAQKTFKQYYANGKLKEIDGPNYHIKYDYQGNEEEKKTWTGKGTENFVRGKLVRKTEVVGGKILITDYDAAGKPNTHEEPVQTGTMAMVADPREYAEDLTEEDFAYYTAQ